MILRPFRPRPPPGDIPLSASAEDQKETPKEGPSNGEQADGQAQKSRRQFSRRRQRNSDSTTSKVKYHSLEHLNWIPVYIIIVLYCSVSW